MLKTSTAINALPYINNTENKSKTMLAINAFANALSRSLSRSSTSVFSFEKMIRPRPEMSKSMISSSAKFVLNTSNVLVSRKTEYTANTGILNLKSNQKYVTDRINPMIASRVPTIFQRKDSSRLFICLWNKECWLNLNDIPG